MEGFIELTDKSGTRFLLNLGVAFGFVEQPDGSVNAVTIAGASVPLGETYEQLREKFADEPEEGA